jgi:hypothetical protein
MRAIHPTRHALAAVVAAIALVVTGCMDRLPTAPDTLESGVTIYEHANFRGVSAHLTNDVRDLREYSGPCEHSTSNAYGSSTSHDWNDCISSLKVAPGWRVLIYREDDFMGERHEATRDVPNLQLVPGSCDHDGLNDCVTSIRVRRD